MPTIRGAVLVLAAMGWTGGGCLPGGQDADAGQGADAGLSVLRGLSVEQLADRLLEKQFLMVDVHVPYEGEIPGTDTSISYLELDALQACIGADRGRDVVLTCMSDHMSTVAGEELLRRGYRNLSHVVGGMRAWQAAGHPLAWRDGGAAACP